MHDDNPSLEASLDDLKAIYRVLAAHHREHPELSKNSFFSSLRRLLEAQATAEGVDFIDDAEWESWLLLMDFDGEEGEAPDMLN